MPEADERQGRLEHSSDGHDADDGEGSQRYEDHDHRAVKKLRRLRLLMLHHLRFRAARQAGEPPSS